MSPETLMGYFLPPGARVVPGVFDKEDGSGKYCMPSAVTDEADRLDIIRQHLSGSLKPRPFTSKRFGKSWRKDHRSYGAYCLLPDGTCPAACIDIDGPDHAKSQSEADALAIRDAAAEAMRRDRLPYFLERSHGAKGWHVWCIFESPQPGAFAHWLAARIGAQALLANPQWTLEAFPKQPKAKTLGSLVALPLPGRPKKPGGGAIVNADGSVRDLATLQLCGPNALAPLLADWRMDCEAVDAAKRLRALALADAPPSDAPGRDVDLEDVAQAFAPTRVNGNSGGEILMDCPRHESASGTSLHVNPERRSWYCHACERGGGGDWAAFSLGRWLLPDASGGEVANKLKTMEKTNGI